MSKQGLRLAAAVFGLLALAMVPALAEDQSMPLTSGLYPPDDPNAPQARYSPRTAALWDLCIHGRRAPRFLPKRGAPLPSIGQEACLLRLELKIGNFAVAN
jgi:hypothetical protein